MDNKTYVSLVNAGQFPEDIKVPIDSPHKDERGTIQNLWLGGCGSVTLITTKAGSVRANHIHIDDWHGAYVVSGEIKYFEENANGEIKEYLFKAGEMFFSPPERWHKMEFPQDTVFITMNGIIKNHENYIKTMHKHKL